MITDYIRVMERQQLISKKLKNRLLTPTTTTTTTEATATRCPTKATLDARAVGVTPVTKQPIIGTSLLVALKREDVCLNVMKILTNLMSSLLTPSLGRSINKLAITG